MIAIEKNIPAPTSHPGRPAKYPWHDMEVGDSFFLPNAGRTEQQRLSTRATAFARRRGFKFATRRMDGGVRVWRLA